MRLASLALLLGAASFAVAEGDAAEEIYEEYVPLSEPTFFDGKEVPPLIELKADTFQEQVSKTKYTVVKYFSPYCPHCIDFAPTYQTLYEYYYTSVVEDSNGSPKPFLDHFSMRWAEINCVAYGDLCTKHGITSYPQTTLYKDGEVLELVRGGKNITLISKLVEDELERVTPGSRPRSLDDLPAPGDKTRPGAAKPSASAAAAAAASAVTKPGEKIAEKPSEKLAEKPADRLAETPADRPAAKPGVKDAEHATVSQAAAPAVATASSAPTKAAPKALVTVSNTKPAKPTATPNEKGVSVSLNAESFQTLVTMTQEPWFIKFYAPWCHHCQAMASNWQQLAKEMRGRLNVGEVNCDAESRLCKDVRLRGYPTILFFRGGERVEYDGLRGLGDFVKYAEKALDICDGVQDVTAASFKALEEKEDVIFVYFYDHATTSEDMVALERLPLSLIGHAKLVKTQDPELYDRFKITTWPRLLVSREGRPTYYTPLTPNEMRDTRQVLGWMKSVWLPIVPEMTASNAREIMDGKLVVLGILNREDQESFLSAKREMKSAAGEWMDKQIQLFQLERQELRDAKQLRIEEAEDRNDQRALRSAKQIRINMDKSDRKEVTFAWVDGVFWQRWLRTTYGIDVKDGERVIINDEDNRRYWDTTVTGNYIIPSRTSILETISKVTVSPPKIKPKLTISSFEKIFFDMRMTFSEHPYLTIGCIAGLALGGASWFRGRLGRRGRGHFRLEDTLPIKEFKEGILGNSANGKKD